MKASKDDNQSGKQTEGHVAGGALSDPHLTNLSDGEHIGLGTNFGIEHYGFISKSDGEQQTK